MYFLDRRDAGRRLAAGIQRYLADTSIREEDLLVLGLPRGGVPVAYEVALALHAPLDVFIVRKLGTPGHRELAMGAIASGGVRLLNDEVVRGYRVPSTEIDRVTRDEMAELKRREIAYRDGLPPLCVQGKIVFLVDDGLATGYSMMAAVRALREMRPAEIIVAVPVAPPEIAAAMGEVANEVICLDTPFEFAAVGAWYRDFRQTSDEEVHELLTRANERS